MTTAWLYFNPYTNKLIVKRDPAPHQFPYIDNATGEEEILIIYGQEIVVPVWDWVTVKDGVTSACWQNRIYDITDCVADGKQNPK